MHLPVHLCRYVSRTPTEYDKQLHYRNKHVVCFLVPPRECGEGTHSNSHKNSRAAERDGSSTAILNPAIKIGHVILPLVSSQIELGGAYQTILPYNANISFEISMIAPTASFTLLSSLDTLNTSLSNLSRRACQ